MLSLREVEMYLKRIARIRESHPLVDIHTHPFEVIFNNLEYRKNPREQGVYSSSTGEYRPLQVSALSKTPAPPENCKIVINEDLKARCLLLTLRQAYQHTGPQVFADQMAMSGIGKVLLLPVLGETVTDYDQMNAMTEMFGQDQRFVFGYCVPNSIGNDEIGEVVAKVVRQHEVKALKIHPAVTGINPGTADGVERVECMLRSCRDNGLSVIIHGGRSPAVKTVENREFGTLDNLQNIDWSLSGNPVVIAHAGSYGYDSEDLLQSTIPKLVGIMDKHDNVFTDISGVEMPTLCRLLNVVESERIVFGSDCLYYPQWRTIVGLLHALCKTVALAEDHFVKITSSNPMKILNCRDVNSDIAGLLLEAKGKSG